MFAQVIGHTNYQINLPLSEIKLDTPLCGNHRDRASGCRTMLGSTRLKSDGRGGFFLAAGCPARLGRR